MNNSSTSRRRNLPVSETSTSNLPVHASSSGSPLLPTASSSERKPTRSSSFWTLFLLIVLGVFLVFVAFIRLRRCQGHLRCIWISPPTVDLVPLDQFCSIRYNAADGSGNNYEQLPGGHYFIAINLHENEDIMSHFLLQLTRLLQLAGGPDRLYVSIYESASVDLSSVWLDTYRRLLSGLGVGHTIVSDHLMKSSNQHRIDFLSQVRNRAMKPMYDGSFEADYVVFVNDLYFCAEDVIRLAQRVVYGSSVDMACGLDMVADPWSAMLLYDIWVTRDMDGNGPRNKYPYFHRPQDVERLRQGQAFNVYSCWNGVIVVSAEAFARGVRFRSAVSSECRTSECTLFCKDVGNVLSGNIVVDPAVTVFYTHYAASRFLQYRPEGVGDVSVPVLTSFPEKEPRPETFDCEPIYGSSSESGISEGPRATADTDNIDLAGFLDDVPRS